MGSQRHTIVLVAVSLCVSARHNTQLGRLPPLGWNTWCTWAECHNRDNISSGKHTSFHDVCNEEMVKDVAQSMIDQGLLKAGWNRVHLDDCWEAPTRDPVTGAMRADPDRFSVGYSEGASRLAACSQLLLRYVHFRRK